MDETTAVTPAPYATAWQRLAAVILDSIILTIPGQIFHMIVPSSSFVQMMGFGAVLSAVFYISLMGSRWQATLGMRLISIQLREAKGQSAVGYGAAALRYAVYVVPAYILLVFIYTSPALLFLSEVRKHSHDPAALRQLLTPETRHAIQHLLIAEVLYLVCAIALYGLPIIFTKQKTGLHDWLSGTRVIQGRPETEAAAKTPDARA